MAYLNREERHDTLLQAAMRVAITEGMAATTVRRVASEAGVSVGQVHHHFASVSHLRVDAFLLLVKQSLAAFAQSSQNLPATERVLRVLGYPQDEMCQRETRLWNEVSILAERDELMKTAYAASMSDWHRATLDVINAGIASDQFRSDINPSDVVLAFDWVALWFRWPDPIYRVRLFGSRNHAPSERDDGNRIIEEPIISPRPQPHLPRAVFAINNSYNRYLIIIPSRRGLLRR